VDAAALPRDGVALRRERAAEGLCRVEAATLLLEPDHAQIVGALDVAGIRREGAGQHVEERRLAAAVRTDQSHARPRRDDKVDAGDDGPPVERLRQPPGDEESAGAPL
jgi:hypothetical protein